MYNQFHCDMHDLSASPRLMKDKRIEMLYFYTLSPLEFKLPLWFILPLVYITLVYLYYGITHSVRWHTKSSSRAWSGVLLSAIKYVVVVVIYPSYALSAEYIVQDPVVVLLPRNVIDFYILVLACQSVFAQHWSKALLPILPSLCLKAVMPFWRVSIGYINP